MRTKFLSGGVVFSIAFAACQQSTKPVLNQTAKPTATISATVSPTNTTSAAPSASISEKTKIKTYDGKGVMTKINLDLVSVELDYEEIKGLMPKMTMEFHVRKKREL
jgi:Cu/Ag efflux protein CusF